MPYQVRHDGKENRMKKISTIIIIILVSIFVVAGEKRFMDIILGGNHIGYYQSLVDTVKNNITVNEVSEMKLIVYNNTVNVKGQNLTIYDKHYTIEKFFSSVISEQMTFYSNGYRDEDQLIVKTVLGNSSFYDTFDISGKTIVFNMELLSDELLEKDLYMFNPLTRIIEKLTVFSATDEDGYDRVLNVKSSTTGSFIYFKDKQVVKSVTREGIIMQKADSKNIDFENVDIVDHFIIQAQGNFKNIKNAKKASFLLYSVGNEDISNYRQSHSGDTLFVSKTPLFIPEKLSKTSKHYVKSNNEISNVINTLKKKTGDDQGKLLQEIMHFVFKRLNKSIVSALLSIDEIMEMGKGDCTEHAQLFAAMALSAGFDADIVTGIVYTNGAFYYHAWNRVLLNGKIYTIDATLNQFDADITHIELSTGYPPTTILLGKMQNKLKIELIGRD